MKNCLSCHQHYLPMGAVGMARQLGLPFDEAAAREEITLSLRHMTMPPDYEAQVVFHPEAALQIGYHGADSWISAAVASWAVMGLASNLRAEDLRGIEFSPPHDGRAVRPGTDPIATQKPDDIPHDFARDIRPVLEPSCLGCHSGNKPKGGFRLETRESMLAGGNRGEPVVVPGNPAASPLLDFVSDAVEDLKMPPLSKRAKFPALTPEEVRRLRAWIAAGATWPADQKLQLL